MTICPIAIAVGCRKCPAFKICPLKGLIGDKPPAPELEAKAKPTAKPKTKPAAKRGAKTRTAAATRK